MIRLIIILLFLIASVLIGVELMNHPGFLLIVLKPWTIQMPLWFALLATIVIFFIFFVLITSLDRLQFLNLRLKNWWRFRRETKFVSKTQQGLSLLIEGRFKKAEKFLLAGVSKTHEPLINYLGAAFAAQQQNAFDRRDQYIQKAYAIAPHEKLTIGITQAELDFNHNQLEQAEANLNQLKQLSPYHPRILSLLEKIYVRCGDWQHLLNLLPSLRKAKILRGNQIFLFEKNLYAEILKSSHSASLNELHLLWQSIPRDIRKNPEVVCAYVNQLSRFNETNEEREELIRKVLKHTWQADLVNHYGTLSLTDLDRQLVIVGAWQKVHGVHPELYLLLGQLCVQIKLWGKAKEYFEKCLSLGPNANASIAYGDLLISLQEKEEALKQYRKGLKACY